MPASDLSSCLEVLVVDDEPAARELLVDYFRTLGFRVSGAHDGRAAIATIQRSHGCYSLVVTDLNLPGADGFAVLQAARQANSSCYVVIVTGYASRDSAVHAVQVGAYDYLPKPFSLGQLDVILARIQDRVRLESENRRLRPPASDIESRMSAVEQALARIESLLAANAR
jgi:DNA-binding NtrC family response regulator